MHISKTVRTILIRFLAVQALIGLVLTFVWQVSKEVSGNDTIASLWSKGSYQEIINTPSTSTQDTMWQQAAILKLGYMHVWTGMQATSPGAYPTRRTTILKAGYLKGKGTPEEAERLLSTLKAKDPGVIGLILALRASLYCDQKKWLECAILAQDSITYDPLAPLGRAYNGIALRQQRIYAPAKKAFETYTSLSGYISQEIMFYRGVVYYYTRNRDLSTGDLSKLINHPVYGFDAKVFLGRNYYDLKDLGAAKNWFLKAKEEKGTGSVTPYLRLARTFLVKKDYATAMSRFQQGYELFPNAMELLTDMLKVAHLQNNTALIKQLENSINYALGTSPGNHEIAWRIHRELKQYDVAENYIRKGIVLLTWVTNPLTQQQQQGALFTQLHHILIKKLYNELQQGKRSDDSYAELVELNINTGQLVFMEGLRSLAKGDNETALDTFQWLPVPISSVDIPYIMARYTIHSRQFGRAHQIIANLKPRAGQEVKTLRLKRALTTFEGAPQANDYLAQLYNLRAIPQPKNGEVVDQVYLLQIAQNGFRPWITRINTYFTP